MWKRIFSLPARMASGGHFYRRSLILLFVVSGVPGFIIGSILYGLTAGRVERELLDNHVSQIEQRSVHLDNQLGNLELLLSHWAFDPKFDWRLRETDFVREFNVTQELTRTLVAMQGSNAIVKSAELYVGGSRPVLLHPEYMALDETRAERYEVLIRYRRFTYWTYWAFDPDRPDEREPALVHHVPAGSLEPFGVLVFRIDQARLAELLRTLSPYDEGVTFTWDPAGSFWLSADGSSADSPFVRALMERIDAAGGRSGSFLTEWKGQTYAVSYGTLSRIASDWRYVSASPIGKITAPVVFISKAILLVSLAALGLAAILAWLASLRIYSPIRRLVALFAGGRGAPAGDEFTLIEREWLDLNRERAELHNRIREQLPFVKHGFLHQLLQGHLHAYSEADLRRRMERLLPGTEGSRFVIVYVRLIGPLGGEGKFREGDEGLVSFAAANLLEELAAPRFPRSETIHFHDMSAGVLLFVPPGFSLMEVIEAFCGEAAARINRILHLHAVFAFGEPVERIRDVPLAFERARQAAGRRLMDRANQIIRMERELADEDAAAELRYSFALERELIHALRTGDEAGARAHLAAFLDSLCGGGAKEIDVQQGMLQLLGLMQHAMMASGFHPNRLYGGANLYAELARLREPKRMLGWFFDRVFAPYFRAWEARSDARVKRLAEQAAEYLQRHYMHDDISLESCAETLGTSPYVLSRAFKQATGVNFIDYLTALRLEKAKQLLRESELKIHDVAGMVGYRHSYFNRIFKKLEGVTPTMYRERSRMHDGRAEA
ncbi:AraC family transcriptional regulator [Thermobacillus sp. ZCTH02-B1]|uniref:helix-turn-helix transcriptional regulator n=1 Tax=Thermobacillus sp. ZCTH02-B1 TaxID=1858795 RepID=UPI0025EA0DCB|nr:AraC family transcriptional regulator [Thermobacillus sp. ZCTH02-B1]